MNFIKQKDLQIIIRSQKMDLIMNLSFQIFGHLIIQLDSYILWTNNQLSRKGTLSLYPHLSIKFSLLKSSPKRKSSAILTPCPVPTASNPKKNPRYGQQKKKSSSKFLSKIMEQTSAFSTCSFPKRLKTKSKTNTSKSTTLRKNKPKNTMLNFQPQRTFFKRLMKTKKTIEITANRQLIQQKIPVQSYQQTLMNCICECELIFQEAQSREKDDVIKVKVQHNLIMFSTKLKPLVPNLTFFMKYFARKSKPIPAVVPPQQYAFKQESVTSTIQMDKNLVNEKISHEVEQKEKNYQTYENNLKQKLKEQVAKELKFDPSFQGEDPTPTKLVNRPGKGVVWGLGGQLMLASKKVQLQGLKDNLQEIVDFLELNQVKNVYVHDFHKDNPERPQTNKRRYHILGSCYSSRHCWKTATELRNAFNLYTGKSKLRRGGKKYDPIFATRTGGKDEQFSMVEFKQFSILLMTQQQRQAMDLEWKWNNEVPEETLDKYTKAKLNRKGRKNQFQDF